MKGVFAYGSLPLLTSRQWQDRSLGAHGLLSDAPVTCASSNDALGRGRCGGAERGRGLLPGVLSRRPPRRAVCWWQGAGVARERGGAGQCGTRAPAAEFPVGGLCPEPRVPEGRWRLRRRRRGGQRGEIRKSTPCRVCTRAGEEPPGPTSQATAGHAVPFDLQGWRWGERMWLGIGTSPLAAPPPLRGLTVLGAHFPASLLWA